MAPARTIALGNYDHGLGTLITAAKYGRWPLPLEVLGEHLGVELDLSLPRRRTPLVVPIPSPALRRLHRGLFHAGVIALAVARVTGWPYVGGLRRGWMPTQVGATPARRQRGGGGLRAGRRFSRALRGQEVVLVDDVRTSGRSLDMASRFCRRLGAKRVSAGILATKGVYGRTSSD